MIVCVRSFTRMSVGVRVSACARAWVCMRADALHQHTSSIIACSHLAIRHTRLLCAVSESSVHKIPNDVRSHSLKIITLQTEI